MVNELNDSSISGSTKVTSLSVSTTVAFLNNWFLLSKELLFGLLRELLLMSRLLMLSSLFDFVLL